MISMIGLVLPTPAFAQTDSEAPAAPSGFLEILFSGGLVGGIMVITLLVLSFIAAYLIFDHLITIRRKDLMPEGLSEQVRQALLNGDVSTAQQACNAHPLFPIVCITARNC